MFNRWGHTFFKPRFPLHCPIYFKGCFSGPSLQCHCCQGIRWHLSRRFVAGQADFNSNLYCMNTVVIFLVCFHSFQGQFPSDQAHISHPSLSGDPSAASAQRCPLPPRTQSGLSSSSTHLTRNSFQRKQIHAAGNKHQVMF